MTPKQLLTYWRGQVHDTKKPYLWTDAEALVYMNLAYFEWVRLVGGLRDSTSDMTQLTVPALTDTVELNPKIIRVLNVRAPSQSYPINVVNAQNSSALNTPNVTGDLRTVIFGEGENTIRVINTPLVDTRLNLVVHRYPLDEVTLTSDRFELRDEQTESLVHGMMYRGFLKDDPDTYDKARSDRAEQRFRALAAEHKAAAESANRVPQAIAYGGL